LYRYVGNSSTIFVDPSGLGIEMNPGPVLNWIYNAGTAVVGALLFDNTPETRSMVYHYMDGSGEPYNLSDSQMNDVASGAMDAIKNEIGNRFNPNNPNSYSGKFDLPANFTDDPGLFSLGDTTLKIEFDCSPGGGCRVKVIVKDEFKDPIDVKDWFEGEVELPGGTPYPIGGEITKCIP